MADYAGPMASLHTQDIVHLLDSGDVQEDPSASVATITTPDGRTLGLSAAGWAAIEHLVAIARRGKSVYVEPVEKHVGLGEAAHYTKLSVEFLQSKVASGELSLEPDALGGTVLVSELVPFAQAEWARRAGAWAEYVRSPEGMDDVNGMDP